MKTKPHLVTTKKVVTTLLAIAAIFLIAFSFSRYRVAQNNADIRGLVLTYYQALDNREYSLVTKLYTPEQPWATENYVDNIQLKMQAIDMKHVQAQKIYPALVNGKFGIVGVLSESTNMYSGQESTLQEFNVLLVRYVDGRWYLAKPEDAKELGEAKLNQLFDKYEEYLKNDSDDLKKVVASQKEAYAKLKKGQESQK